MRGRTRDMGLGGYPSIGLAKARELAGNCRGMVASGLDPIEARSEKRAAANVEAAKSMTFDGCAKAYIAAHEAAWRNAKHRQQWRTRSQPTQPVIGPLPVAAVDTGLVLKVVEAIWSKKPETASRVRGRIEVVLDWAKVRGYRDGENPARGAAISTICCRQSPRSGRSSTTPRYPMRKSARSWRRCVSSRASVPARLSS